ncbi:MAG: ankyrin repeat domain-containing protein [Oligoflexia bacterium]|nr:ankyrin repeat domain-containing protein [Oligoflexia bacterium]
MHIILTENESNAKPTKDRGRWRWAFLSVLISCTFVILFAGCSRSGTNVPINQTETGGVVKNTPAVISKTKILGGTEVTSGGWSNVVGLTEKANGVFCSGTLLASNLVVTAAHCLEKYQLNPSLIKSDELSVYIGDGEEGGKFFGQYRVKSCSISPNYRKSDRGWSDFAFAILEQEVDSVTGINYIKPITDYREILDNVKHGAVVHLVGFGRREKESDTTEAAMPTQTKLTPIGKKFEVDVAIDRISGGEVLINESNGKGSWRGDSGGPLFIKLTNGEWRLLGGVSRGDRDGISYYGMIPDVIDWVFTSSGSSSRSKTDLIGTGLEGFEVGIHGPIGPLPEDVRGFRQICEDVDTKTNRYLNHTVQQLRLLSAINVARKDATTQTCEEVYQYINTLEEINLDSQYISDLSPLNGFNNLKTIYLRNNYLVNLGPLLKLSTLELKLKVPSLQKIYLAQNPYLPLAEIKKLGRIVDFTFEDLIQVMDAAHNGNQDRLQLFKYLLDLDPDKYLHISDSNGATLLYHAAEDLHLEIAALLLEHGADPNVLNKMGRSIMISLMLKQLPSRSPEVHAMLKLLLEHGADPNIKDVSGESVLHVLDARGRAGLDYMFYFTMKDEIFYLFLKHGFKLREYDRDQTVSRLVTTAINESYNFKLLLTLEKLGFTMKYRVAFSDVFASMIRTGDIETLTLLLDTNKVTINDLDNNGYPFICLAVDRRKFDVIELLLKRGVSPDVRCDPFVLFETTLLNFAAAEDNTHLLQLLLTMGKGINDYAPATGLAPLHVAVARGKQEMVRFLLTNGANPDLPSITPDIRHPSYSGWVPAGRTPLHTLFGELSTYFSGAQNVVAMEQQKLRLLEIERLLLESSANRHALVAVPNVLTGRVYLANSQDERGEAPLHLLASDPNNVNFIINNPNVVQELVRTVLLAGADPNLRSIQMQETPFIKLLAAGELRTWNQQIEDFFGIYLQYGARIDAHWSQSNDLIVKTIYPRGNPGLLKFLLELDLNPNFYVEGYTPLHFAISYLNRGNASNTSNTSNAPNILFPRNLVMEIVDVLLQHGADPQAKVLRENEFKGLTAQDFGRRFGLTF